MYRLLLFGAALAAGTLPCGCLSRQVARDGNGLRNAVADMYTDQAMDNLIRARNNLPFVHLKFYQLNVTDTDQMAGEAGVNQTINATRDVFVATATRALTNVYNAGGSLSRNRVMSFNADPITDQNDIYQLYLDFACDPALLVESDAAPPGPVHVHRKCGKKHYWVPCEAGPAFLQLVLKTSLMRGPEAAPPVPAAYAVTVTQVLNPAVFPEPRDIANATLVFDKPVPNGEATLVVDLDDGRRVRASLWPVGKDAEGKRVELGQPTTRLEIQWAPKRDGFTANNLQGRPARVYSRDFPPEAPVPNPVLGRIATDVNQLKINQFSGQR